MKKITSIIMLFIIMISFVGCGGDFSTLTTNQTTLTTNYTTERQTTTSMQETTLPSTITTNETVANTWTTDKLITTEQDEFVSNLLASLTLREKASQMVQAERSSITNEQVTQYGIGSILSGGGSHPIAYDDSVDTWYDMYSGYQTSALNSSSGIPIIYGIDAVHGNNNLFGATIFPHNIGLGMANNPELMYEISKATAEEMLVTGINWTFAPAFSVVQDFSWGRTYEGFSENPEIHNNLAQAAILGFEENGVSATAKHYIGDGGTFGGIDQGNTQATEDIIRELYLPPYYEAVEAGVDTIMISYSSINGIKMHGNQYWINDVLKEELGFKGFIISDWNAIHQLPGSFYDQVVMSVNAGIDMLMEPYDWALAIDQIVMAVNNNHISMDRVDEAVTRILTVKYDRGLFEDPFYKIDDSYLYSQEHQDLARQAARESLVLLKNDNNSLPLSKDENLYILGPASDHVGLLCGGWTTYWQGNNQADIGVGTSIKAAMTSVLNNHSGILSENWQNADTVVVVLAENPYSEGAGDNDNLTLTGGNANILNESSLLIVKEAHEAGKNVVGILVGGRPLFLEEHLQYFDSFIAAWLPGSEGGLAVSDLLFGDYDFVGVLSFTWPVDITHLGYTSNREDYDETLPLFPYGYGLRYN
ncbi:MAG: glycoside hydrolase family 3 protein [Candidatus Izimaplasma sp.]|nr:glycoside hydrolase family 3 protein [Candidatus Izimaplasma bacterium]